MMHPGCDDLPSPELAHGCEDRSGMFCVTGTLPTEMTAHT